MGRLGPVACAVAVAVLVGDAAGQPRQPTEAERVGAAIEALPVLGEIDAGSTPIVVRGDLGPRRARAMVALVRRVKADVDRRFVAARATPAPAVTLCLFDDEAAYAAMVATFDDDDPSAWGFYRGDLRVAVANLAASTGNLRHELVHPLIGDDFPSIPAWLNEGMGALYGTAKPTRDGFEPLVNYRLRDLQRAIADGTLPSFAELVGSDRADVYSERAPTFYAMGRYILLYLHRRGRLDAVYAALRDAGADPEAHLAILRGEIDEATFVRWVTGLRYRSRR
jgi:hypothetical protein